MVVPPPEYPPETPIHVPVIVPPYTPPEKGPPASRIDADELLNSVEAENHAANQRIRQLTTALRETSARRKYLESIRVDHLDLLQVIREELLLMQQGIDRITAALNKEE